MSAGALFDNKTAETIQNSFNNPIHFLKISKYFTVFQENTGVIKIRIFVPTPFHLFWS